MLCSCLKVRLSCFLPYNSNWSLSRTQYSPGFGPSLPGGPQRSQKSESNLCQVRHELSCWSKICTAQWVCTIDASCRQACILVRADKGHLGIIKLNKLLVRYRPAEAIVRDRLPTIQDLGAHLRPCLQGALWCSIQPILSRGSSWLSLIEAIGGLCGVYHNLLPTVREESVRRESVRRLSQLLKNGIRAQLTDGSTFSTVLQTLSYCIFLSGALQKLLCGLCRSRLAGTDYLLLLREIKMAHETDLGKAQSCMNWEERQPLFYSRQPLLLSWAAGRCVRLLEHVQGVYIHVLRNTSSDVVAPRLPPTSQ